MWKVKSMFNMLYHEFGYIGQYLLWLLVAVLALIALRAICWKAWYIVFPMPMTRFGFRGLPVYVDKGRKTRVFVSKRYELSAKPDFIYKTGHNEYAIVEYKSAKRPMRDMDWWQVVVSIIAARERLNIRAAYVATSLGVYKVHEASSSTARLYRKVKRHHRLAKQIKHKNVRPKKINPANCSSCSKRNTCERRL